MTQELQDIVSGKEWSYMKGPVVFFENEVQRLKCGVKLGIMFIRKNSPKQLCSNTTALH